MQACQILHRLSSDYFILSSCQGASGNRAQVCRSRGGLFIDWLLNVPATCWCISGNDLPGKFTCCHTETEVADQTLYLTQPQYTGTRPTSPSADPIMSGTWQGSHWRANLEVLWYDSTRYDSNPGSVALEADASTTKPARRLVNREDRLSDLPYHNLVGWLVA